jgi:hypothetical protein
MTSWDIYASALVTAPSGDPQYFFTTSCLPGMSYNFGAYENEHVNELIEELSKEFDTEKRAQLAKQALASATGRTVEEVFGIVAHAEQNKYLVIDDRKPEPAVTEAPLTAPAARKSLRPLWITAGVLLAAAAVGTGMWIFRKPEEVSAFRYLTASFTGIDGLGTAEITAQESGNKRLDAIIPEEYYAGKVPMRYVGRDKVRIWLPKKCR